MSKGFVYIASLSHSGSTLLDLLLGIHPKLVGLGEIIKVLSLTASEIDENLHMACSCGQRAEDCVFWGPLFPKLKAVSETAMPERYTVLVNHFYKLYAADTRIVDSSKYQKGLNFAANVPEMSLSVIHLFKDVRAFTISHRKSTESEMDIDRLPIFFSSRKFSVWIYSQSIKSALYLFLKWRFRNRRLQKAINNIKASSIQISYDQLAQDPTTKMQKIFAFLKLKTMASQDLIPAKSKSHIFMGNPMIGDAEKMSSIKYDDRWQKSSDWQLVARLFPLLGIYNDWLLPILWHIKLL